jgi:hypothetical protein
MRVTATRNDPGQRRAAVINPTIIVKGQMATEKSEPMLVPETRTL